MALHHTKQRVVLFLVSLVWGPNLGLTWCCFFLISKCMFWTAILVLFVQILSRPCRFDMVVACCSCLHTSKLIFDIFDETGWLRACIFKPLGATDDHKTSWTTKMDLQSTFKKNFSVYSRLFFFGGYCKWGSFWRLPPLVVHVWPPQKKSTAAPQVPLVRWYLDRRKRKSFEYGPLELKEMTLNAAKEGIVVGIVGQICSKKGKQKLLGSWGWLFF